MWDQYYRREIEGQDKTNQEPKKKHAIKPSAVLRTERKGRNGVPKCTLNAITHKK